MEPCYLSHSHIRKVAAITAWPEPRGERNGGGEKEKMQKRREFYFFFLLVLPQRSLSPSLEQHQHREEKLLLATH